MSVTLPRITAGWSVNSTNCDIPFDRGGNLTATMRYGDYGSGAEIATEAARAMNAADSGQSYTCAYSNGQFVFDNGATAFAIEWSRLTTTNAAGLFGFDEADSASTAGGHTSTDTVGNESGNTYFLNAGVFSWAPTDPIHATTPIAASGAGTAGTLLQRMPFVTQLRSDGGSRESCYYSTDKLLRLNFRWIAGAERTRMERFLDWIERGRRFMYQPDATSASYVVLMLRDPGEIAGAHEWLTRSEISYPELTFVEAVDR